MKGTEYRYASYNGTTWAGSTGAAADIVADATTTGQFLVDGRIVYLEGAEVVHAESTALAAGVSAAIAAIKTSTTSFYVHDAVAESVDSESYC